MEEYCKKSRGVRHIDQRGGIHDPGPNVIRFRLRLLRLHPSRHEYILQKHHRHGKSSSSLTYISSATITVELAGSFTRSLQADIRHLSGPCSLLETFRSRPWDSVSYSIAMKPSDSGSPLMRRKSSTAHYQTFSSIALLLNPKANPFPTPPIPQTMTFPIRRTTSIMRSSPLPKKQMVILAIISLSEQTALNSISPFLTRHGRLLPRR